MSFKNNTQSWMEPERMRSFFRMIMNLVTEQRAFNAFWGRDVSTRTCPVVSLCFNIHFGNWAKTKKRFLWEVFFQQSWSVSCYSGKLEVDRWKILFWFSSVKSFPHGAPCVREAEEMRSTHIRRFPVLTKESFFSHNLKNKSYYFEMLIYIFMPVIKVREVSS